MDDKQHKLPRQTWEELIPGATPDAIDLMKQLFTYDPSKRLNAKQVLQHPFLKELYDADDDQIVEGEPVRYYDFEFE